MPKSAIAALVITTQRGTTLALDKQGLPLRPAMIWLDQRRADKIPKLAWWWQAAFRAIGMLDTVRFFQREAEANWIAQHQPELWASTALLSKTASTIHLKKGAGDATLAQRIVNYIGKNTRPASLRMRDQPSGR